ncbi:LysM domain-containing protein [Colletotrichum musicola]|uniref:LysM domain-containing protein n=1 Tax=Colletotrichum musicola TaxID=2175873 RepID=A0A8H6K5X2_9PEZI|nr:LysM domain-containing protein [Colletotrichum musicola]
MQPFLVNLLVAASTASATVLLYLDSLPSTLASECTTALTVDVTGCDPLVRNLRPDVFYPPASLTRICTADCSSAIEEWRSSVKAQCGNQTLPADLGVEAAAVHIPGSLQFCFLNPAVNANCTNLFASESYCVAAVGDINTYSGRPGYGAAVTLNPSTPFDGVPYTERPDATSDAPDSQLYTAPPRASGTRAECVHYFNGDDFHFDLAGLPFASNCELAADTYDVDYETFGLWNAGLGDVSDPNCAFKKGVRYCGSWYVDRGGSGEPAAATTVGGGEDSTNTSSMNKSSMNTSPAITSPTSTSPNNTSPTNKSPTSTSPTNASPPNTSPTNTSPTPPGPTMSGSPADCNKWSLVTDGLSCTDMASEAGISLEQFLAWNPAVSPDCLKNFWLAYAYCVGVSGGSTPTKTAPGPPGPTAEGEPDN